MITCELKKDGETIASATGNAANDSEAVARNSAVMQITSEMEPDEEYTLTCE